MLRSKATKILATVAAMNILAGYIATAQSAEQAAIVTRIHFPTGDSTLDDADKEAIRSVAARMQSEPALIATIIGKADAVGSKDLNEKLSQRRAEAVFEALVYTNHIPENRVELRWTGERLPFMTTEEEKEESQNRVAEIVLH